MLLLDSGHALDGLVPGRHVIDVLKILVRRTMSSSSVMRHPAAKTEKMMQSMTTAKSQKILYLFEQVVTRRNVCE